MAAAAMLSLHLFSEYFYNIEWTYGISMLPTLAADGDPVLVSRRERRGRDIIVGDLVSFKHPLKPEERMLKRVVALQGDFVLRDSPHKDDKAAKTKTMTMMIQVPQGHCYVEGDNLDHSRDSRMFGPLPVNLILGKVLYVFRKNGGYIPMPQRITSGLVDAVED